MILPFKFLISLPEFHPAHIIKIALGEPRTIRVAIHFRFTVRILTILVFFLLFSLNSPITWSRWAQGMFSEGYESLIGVSRFAENSKVKRTNNFMFAHVQLISHLWEIWRNTEWKTNDSSWLIHESSRAKSRPYPCSNRHFYWYQTWFNEMIFDSTFELETVLRIIDRTVH